MTPSQDGDPPGPLFQTPGDRVASRLPDGVSGLFLSYLGEPLVEASVLEKSIRIYLDQLEANRGEREFLDISLARAVATWCGALVDALSRTGSEDERRLVQAAVRYFVEEEDAESDLDSPIGFDDDAWVVEAVARELGRDEILNLTGEEA